MTSPRTLDTWAQAQASILEQMHCAVIATDLEGQIVYWNQFAEQQFQWKAEDVLGRRFDEVILPADAREGAIEVLPLVRSEGHLELDAQLVRRDGTPFDGHTVVTTLRSADGEIIGQIGVTSDVTEQRTTQRRLSESEERFRSLAEGAPLMIWMTDTTGQLEYVNSRFCDITGWSNETLREDTWIASLHPDDQAGTRQAYVSAMAERREIRHEFRVHDVATDTYMWMLGRATPRTSADGTFLGFIGYGVDITDRRREQEARAEGATVAAALAEVGQELISSLNSPDFLDRLCALTAQHLSCESSHSLLLRPEDDVFELIAGTYATNEDREASMGLRVPRHLMDVLTERLRDTEVATVGTIPEAFLERNPELEHGNCICLALRQGPDLIGVQAVRRGDATPFSDTDLAIARGIAHLASLALDHARLVDELEQAGRVKSDFVATMSHELRTPLHVILGYTDLLITEEFGPLLPEQADTARRIDRRARELHDLITNTLDVSRLDSGRVLLHVEEVSLSGLLSEVDLDTQRQQEDVGLALRIELPEDLPTLRSDPMKLKVVLKNLISNALKFTTEGSVTVRGRADDRGIEISVEDTGIGIEEGQLAAIFEPFQQVDGSSSRRHGGAGLGLYIVRRLVDLLGGSITVESAPGAGSTFRIWLPRSLDHTAA
ncbi:MAG: PAS domain S-box protein [Candidatus Binatia bacterium]|nr:PAS domain S-box protein [Candidatus Binatia bacterium]